MTSDERHEMAERLRALLDDDLDFDDPRSDVSLTEVEVALRLLGGFYDNSTKAEYVQHLADLIDRPTCHDVADFDRESFKCSRCGFRVLSIDGAPDAAKLVGTKGGVIDFGYCPNCGAMVVEKGAER